jgi:O-antigen ligase
VTMGVVFFGFLLVALNWIVGWNIYDTTLVPRLLALMVFLTLALAWCARPTVWRRLDFSVLRSPVVACFGLYALVTGASLSFAINPTAGFNDFFRTVGALVVLCLSCLVLASTPRWPILLVRIVCIAAAGACVLGYYQIVSKFGWRVPDREEVMAVTGLMSNVNLYAGFLNLLMPFCICGIFLQRGFWRAAAGLCSVALVVLVILLQSRGAYIGMGAFLLVTGAAVVFLGKNLGVVLSRRSLVWVGAAAVLAVAGLAVVLAGDNPVAQRFRTLLTADFQTIDGGRLMVWQMALEMAHDYFFTGAGAGNFTIRMHEYIARPGRDFSGIALNWAQPHNDFLWVFAEKGIFGLLAFAGIFVFAIAAALRALRGSHSRENAWAAVCALAGLTAYVTASCFDFPLERINQQVFFAVLLAVAVAANHQPLRPPGKIPPAIVVGAALAIVLMLLGSAYSIAALRQEHHVKVARGMIARSDFLGAVVQTRLAATPWKTLDPVGAPVAFLEGHAFLKAGQIQAALPLLRTAREQNPNRLYILRALGEACLAAGLRDEAFDCFSYALKLYPQDAPLRLLLEKARTLTPTPPGG